MTTLQDDDLSGYITTLTYLKEKVVNSKQMGPKMLNSKYMSFKMI